MGERRLAPTSAGIRPVRASQAVNTRTAVARRAKRRAGAPGHLLVGQPAAQGAQVELGQVGLAEPVGVLEEAGDVGEVGPHRVGGQVALGDQVALVVGEHRRQVPGRARHARHSRSATVAGPARLAGTPAVASLAGRGGRAASPAGAARPGRRGRAGGARTGRRAGPSPAVEAMESTGAGLANGTASRTCCVARRQPVAGRARRARRRRRGGCRRRRRPRAPRSPWVTRVAAPLRISSWTPCGLGAGHRAGHAHQVAVEAGGPAGGVERAAASRRLDDDGAAGQGGDEPVAAEEAAPGRCAARAGPRRPPRTVRPRWSSRSRWAVG